MICLFYVLTVVVNSNGKSIFRVWSTNTKTDLSLLNFLVCAMHYGPHSDFKYFMIVLKFQFC